MRERKRLSDFNIHIAADIVVNSTRRARYFDRRNKPLPLGPEIASQAVAEFEKIVGVRNELFGISATNPEIAEQLQSQEQKGITEMLKDQPLYLREAQNIISNAFEIDFGNSLK